jgi:hypothetical protein
VAGQGARFGLVLRTLPSSRIVGGRYDGRHVLLAQDRDERLYFAVPSAGNRGCTA